MTCHEVEDNLAAYVDGLAPRAAQIDAHLATCADCRASVHAQRVARTVLRERAGALTTPAAPGLRTRLRALAEDDRASARQAAVAGTPPIGWTGRLTAFAAAAMVVLTLGAILLPVATVRSTALLAAQLALDHLKCFTIDGDADGEPIDKAAAETTLQQDFDLSVTVPPSLPAERIELMAVRRCLYGDGRAAHLMYRVGGEPVSLFVLPGLARPAQELSLFGHDEVVWTQGGRTYMLVARAGLGGGLERVASYLRTEAK